MSLAGLVWLLLALASLLAVAAGAVTALYSPGRAFVLLVSTEAVVLAATTAGLIAYVAGEDDYRRTGVSRWDAYDAQALTVTAVGVALAAITAFFLALGRRSSSLAVLASVAALAACALLTASFLANSLN